jgi:hypothetical protein
MIDLSNLDRYRKERKVGVEFLIQRVNEGESCEAASENFIFGCGQKRVGATANFPPSGGGNKANFFVETPGLPQNWHLWRSPPGVPSQSLRGGNLAIPNRSCLMTRKIQRFRPVRKRFRKTSFVEKVSHMPMLERTAICNLSRAFKPNEEYGRVSALLGLGTKIASQENWEQLRCVREAEKQMTI